MLAIRASKINEEWANFIPSNLFDVGKNFLDVFDHRSQSRLWIVPCTPCITHVTITIVVD